MSSLMLTYLVACTDPDVSERCDGAASVRCQIGAAGGSYSVFSSDYWPSLTFADVPPPSSDAVPSVRNLVDAAGSSNLSCRQ